MGLIIAHRMCSRYAAGATAPTNCNALFSRQQRCSQPLPSFPLLPQVARRFIDDQKPRYQAARQVYRDRKRLLESIEWTSLAVPPHKVNMDQHRQAMLWQDYLQHEKSNPQRLEPSPLMQRVRLAYDQAVMYLYLYPELWNDYANWEMNQGGGAPMALQVGGRVCVGHKAGVRRAA